MLIYFLPFLFQGIAMFVDEFYFHRKRGLPIWERVGHPLDTLSVLICYLYIYLQKPSQTTLSIYIGLCAFSCVLVTKDEFVHTKLCDAKENWLHAFLFILHPITFLSAGLLWMFDLSPDFIAIQPFVIGLFLIYQIFYWSFFGNGK